MKLTVCKRWISTLILGTWALSASAEVAEVKLMSQYGIGYMQ